MTIKNNFAFQVRLILKKFKMKLDILTKLLLIIQANLLYLINLVIMSQNNMTLQ